MTQNSNEVTATALAEVIPGDILSLFGAPPLVGGENRGLYERLRCQVALAVEPQNVIEWLYIKDVVDLDWEIRRYRHMQSVVLNSRVVQLIDPKVCMVETIGVDESEELTKPPFDIAIALRTQTRDEIAERLKEDYAIDFDAEFARAFTLCRKEIEALERMLASAESRRNAVLREIGLHRNMGSFAKRLDEISAKFVDSNVHDGRPLLENRSVDELVIDSDDVSVVP